MQKSTPPVSLGDTFGRLTVLAFPKGSRALCICSCGSTKTVATHDLKSGHSRSCGCLAKDALRERNILRWTTHGDSDNKHTVRLYRIWAGMKTRCDNPSCHNHNLYGGRGITVCTEWATSYETFRDWAIRSGYTELLSIDRIDNSLGYFPDNCRWATRAIQSRNKRSNRFVVAFGETKCIQDWARDTRCNVPFTTLIRRINDGWDIEEAITTPPLRLRRPHAK